jgi:hypothetical protein
MPLLADVIEPREPDVAVLPEEAWKVPVAAHRHDGDALGLEVAPTATRQRLDGTAVARALNEHYAGHRPVVHCAVAAAAEVRPSWIITIATMSVCGS